MMIKADGKPEYMPLYEALASEVRWRIMSLIAEREMNVKDIADKLALSPSIVTLHIRKLEAAGLTGSRRVRLNGERISCASSKQQALISSCRLPARTRRCSSRVFLWVIIRRLKFIQPAGWVHMRWRSGCGMIRVIFGSRAG